jgi:hypothetical protein
MLYAYQIRKLIHEILNYFHNKEIKKDKEKCYYNYIITEYQNEFECLINENKIGIYTNLNKKDSIICLKLLEMLYERNYQTFTNLYFLINKYENIKDWITVLKLSFNNIKLNKYKIIPIPLKNYKTKKPQKFYEINDIIKFFY